MNIKEVTIKVSRTIQVTNFQPITFEITKLYEGTDITDAKISKESKSLAFMVDTNIHDYISENYK